VTNIKFHYVLLAVRFQVPLLARQRVFSKLKVFTRQADVLMPGKCRDMRRYVGKATITGRPTGELPKLASTFLFDSFYTGSISVCKKFVRLPIKGGRPHL
jgi:hypothetical protein